MKEHAKKSREPLSYFGQLLKEEMYNMKPEEFTLDDFVSHAANEAWNLDEFSAEGYMMMKHLLFRLVTVKKDWYTNNTPTMKEFIEMAKKVYLKKLNGYDLDEMLSEVKEPHEEIK